MISCPLTLDWSQLCSFLPVFSQIFFRIKKIKVLPCFLFCLWSHFGFFHFCFCPNKNWARRLTFDILKEPLEKNKKYLENFRLDKKECLENVYRVLQKCCPLRCILIKSIDYLFEDNIYEKPDTDQPTTKRTKKKKKKSFEKECSRRHHKNKGTGRDYSRRMTSGGLWSPWQWVKLNVGSAVKDWKIPEPLLTLSAFHSISPAWRTTGPSMVHSFFFKILFSSLLFLFSSLPSSRNRIMEVWRRVVRKENPGTPKTEKYFHLFINRLHVQSKMTQSWLLSSQRHQDKMWKGFHPAGEQKII